MPIPYRDYPPDWFRHVRPRILARSSAGRNAAGPTARLWRTPWPDRCCYGLLPATPTTPERVVGAMHAAVGGKRPRVKLAIAHLDPDPRATANLRALCQGGHLRPDRRDNGRCCGKAVATGLLVERDFATPCPPLRR